MNPNGTKKWSYLTGGIIDSSPAIGNDGTIYFTSEDNYFYAMNPYGTVNWKYKTASVLDSSPSIAKNGIIYLADSSGLNALNPNDTLKWIYPTLIASDLTIGSDGTIYFASDWDTMSAVNPNGTEKWIFHKQNETGVLHHDTTPIIGSDGSIYFGNGQVLYAIKDVSARASVRGGYYNKTLKVSIESTWKCVLEILQN